MLRPRHTLQLAFTALLSVASCGGAPSGDAASAASAAATPGQRCIAEADVKRASKANEPDRINVKHVLVRFAGARGASEAIARTREQACLRAGEALAKLKEGTSFGEVVASYSDDAGAATRGGAIGNIERGDVAAPFADAAFELKVSEVSEVVETPFGFHVILRVE